MAQYDPQIIAILRWALRSEFQATFSRLIAVMFIAQSSHRTIWLWFLHWVWHAHVGQIFGSNTWYYRPCHIRQHHILPQRGTVHMEPKVRHCYLSLFIHSIWDNPQYPVCGDRRFSYFSWHQSELIKPKYAKRRMLNKCSHRSKSRTIPTPCHYSMCRFVLQL